MKTSNILREGSIFVGTVCAMNFGIFLYTNLILFNPFASLLCLIASPFFYWMGVVAEREVQEGRHD